MPRYIAIDDNGKTEVHASSDGTGLPYDTLCGLDGNDSAIGTCVVGLQIGARINCPQCKALILAAKEYRPRDFSRPAHAPTAAADD